MSCGCINFKKNDFLKLVKDLKLVDLKNISAKCKIYILPEEKDNHLKLIQQKNGITRFIQIKYKSRTEIKTP